MSDQLAIEAARQYAMGERKRLHFADAPAWGHLVVSFMAGAAWQAAQSAKMLDGVVRARNRDVQDTIGGDTNSE